MRREIMYLPTGDILPIINKLEMLRRCLPNVRTLKEQPLKQEPDLVCFVTDSTGKRDNAFYIYDQNEFNAIMQIFANNIKRWAIIPNAEKFVG